MIGRINAETAAFDKLVDARFAEIEDSDLHIFYPEYIYKHNKYSATSIPVCNTSLFLKQLGFQDKIIYDTEHFKNHMLVGSYDGGFVHGHNGTKESLKSMPYLLNNPVAVIDATLVEGKRNEQYKEAPLIVMSAAKENNRQKYYFMVISVNDYYDGVMLNYKASKIITYRDVSEDKFSRYLNKASDLNSILYFNKNEYNKISFSFGKCRCPDEKVTLKTFKYPEYSVKANKHLFRVSSAATQSILRFNNKNSYFTTPNFYPLFDDAMQRLESGKASLKELTQLQRITNITTKLCDDKFEARKASETVDLLIASRYCQIIKSGLGDKSIKSVVEQISNIEVRCEDDIDKLYDEIDKLEKTLPTLNNCKLKFSDSLKEFQKIREANFYSHSIYNETRDALSEIINNKINMMEEYEIQSELEAFAR